jgi:nitroreductase
MNQTIHLINRRVSLRKFSDKLVSKEDKETIINSALRAPTAGNLMLYSIIKVESKKTLNILSTTCDNQPFIKNAAFALIFLVDYQKLYDYFGQSNFLSYCKEQGVDPSYPELSDLLLGAQDAICAAQNSVIAAESLGIGSCYIGDIIENYEIHRDLFDLEDYSFPLGMLVFGHYPENINRTPRSRYNQKYVVFDEKYRRFNSDELKDMFHERESSFKSDNTLGAKNAAQMIYAKKFGSPFALEMRRSVKIAYKKWLK